MSDSQNINIGVPQGSIQGPLLFIIYVNSLPDSVTCKCIMYADDTTLLCSSSDPISLQSDLTSSLTSIATWFKVSKLTFNVKKIKLMIFGTNNILKNFENISLTYAKDLIDRVDSYKYLGVLFNPWLTWCNHVNSISSRISKRIGLIRRIKFFLPISILNKLAKALVMPHFDFVVECGLIVMFNTSIVYRFSKNRLARVLVSADIRTRIVDLMNTLNWSKLDQRWKRHILLTFFKCLKGDAPVYLSSQFSLATHSHHTRGQTFLKLLKYFDCSILEK